MTGLIRKLHLVLTCVWVICSILIVVAQWRLVEQKDRYFAWQTATTQSLKRGVARYESLPPSALSRSAGPLAGRKVVSTQPVWLLTWCLLTALLIIFIVG